MTTATATAPATSGGQPGARRGRAVTVLVVLGVAVVVLVLIALAAPSRRNDGPPLDPGSTGTSGTKAAVELARRLGADVRISSSVPRDDVEVALMFEDLTADDVVPALRSWISRGHTLVVADPSSQLTPVAEREALDPLEDSAVVDQGDCDTRVPAGLTELGALEAFGPVARFEVPDGAQACFQDDAGAVVVVEAVGEGLLVSVGSPWLFTNEALDHADNAGLFAALAVPERGTRLAILEAGDGDDGLQAPSSDDSLGLPTGVALGLLQLLVAFIVYALYRARRLGKPVNEDPPVVIAGSELVRAVGGLLEHAGARDRSAASLRRSTRRRLAAAFGLPAGATADAVVDTVAVRAALDRERLADALVDGPVADDRALARLARELDDLVAAAVGRPQRSPTGPGPATDPAPSEPTSNRSDSSGDAP